VRSFRYRDGQAVDRMEWPALGGLGFITSFGEDAQGELYLVVRGGTVYKLVRS